MPNTIVNTVKYQLIYSLKQAQSVDIVIIYFSQRRGEPWPREVEYFSQGHAASQWQSWDLNSKACAANHRAMLFNNLSF